MTENKGTLQIKKEDSINIIQISIGYSSSGFSGSSNVYGLGSDMKIYSWKDGSEEHYSPGFGNCWVYYEQRI